MSIVRLIVAWLVMAALPLQGFAAASMLFCDQATHSTATAERGHDHASHDHGASPAHDHASHAHEASAADGKLAKQAGDQSSAGVKADGHACPVCASCCNLVAVFETPTLALGQDSPQSKPSEEVARVATRAPPAPDKPPRA